jgi:dihydroorotate dehydrogenase
MAIRIAKAGLAPLHRPSAAEQRVSLQHKLVFDDKSPTYNTDDGTDSAVSVTTTRSSKIKPLMVDNPIGLAAGFDKDGEIIQPLFSLGFGVVEIGTVTPRPQPGNPSPRMFRLVADKAIINRYGFNSRGASVVLQNVLEFQQQQHSSVQKQREQEESQPIWKQIVYTLYPQASTIFTLHDSNASRGLLGINIGKNKSSTTNEQVVQDYVTCIQMLGPVADYLVINVSSPNTAGLRDEWQKDVSNLQTLLQACIQARNQLVSSSSSLPPLFVKLAPDLPDESLRAIVNVCLGNHANSSNGDDENDSRSSRPLVDGIVVTNTTTARPADLLSWQNRHELGGLSGEPLKDASTTCIRKIYALTRGKLPIIGVGGISSGRDAYEKLQAGASLVQVYSAMVYQGPGVISRIRQELATLMRNNGQRCVGDVVGTDHPDIVYTNHFSSATSSYDSHNDNTTRSSLRAVETARKGEGTRLIETVVSNDADDRHEYETMSSLFPNGSTIHGDDNAIAVMLNHDAEEKKDEIG